MIKTGRLRIDNGESRLDGTLLARKGAPDPLGAATSFLANLGLRDGDCITVSGENGTIDSTSVVFMDSASKAQESLCSEAAVAADALALRAATPVKAAGAKKKSRIKAPKTKSAWKPARTAKKKGQARKKRAHPSEDRKRK